ncbi:MAG: CPBP family intramembrane glutamic endopeptidase [Pseudomonadota bacterium]
MIGGLVVVSVLAWWLEGWLPFEYLKVASRLVLLMVAIGVGLLVIRGGINLEEMGLGPFVPAAFVRVFGLGLVSLLLPVGVFLLVEYRVPDDRVEWWAAAFVLGLIGSVFTSLLVAVFEEVLFRGWLLTRLQRSVAPIGAALLCSLAYASVHFVGLNDVTPPAEMRWYTLLFLLPAILAPMFDVAANWDSLASLLAVGLLLCLVRSRWGLWPCIALHAAWVFGIRLFKDLTVRDEVNPYLFLVGDYDRFNGLLVFGYLLILILLLWVWQRRSGDWTPGSGAGRA